MTQTSALSNDPDPIIDLDKSKYLIYIKLEVPE